MSKTITPILLLGSARNGTTWLGNALSLHPEISGAQHPFHWGQIESNVLLNQNYAGAFAKEQQYVSFLEAFSCSDYFLCAKGNKKYFYQNPSRDFYDMFFDLMDQFAHQEGNVHWVTKLDTRFYSSGDQLSDFLARLHERYPRVHYIAIQRQFEPALKSYLNMESENSIYLLSPPKKQLAIFLQSARYIWHYRQIARIIQQNQGIFLRFEDFKSNPRQELTEICQFIGLDYTAQMLEPKYKPNSSFAASGRHKDIGKWPITLAKQVYLRLFRVFPVLANLLLKARASLREDLHPFEYRILMHRQMPEKLKILLQRNGETALYHLIFGTDTSDEPRSD